MLSTKKRIILGITMAIVSVLVSLALIDFLPQQSHLMTTNYFSKASNLTGKFGAIMAFWLFRFFGASAYLVSFLSLSLFLYLCFPQKISFRYIFSIIGMFFLFSALFGWIQHIYQINVFSTMTAGLGGILGDLMLQKFFLPLFGKFGSIFIIFILLFFQMTFHIYSFFQRHPLLQKPFIWGWNAIQSIFRIGSKLIKANDKKIEKESSLPKPKEKEIAKRAERQDFPDITSDVHDYVSKVNLLTSNVQIFEETAIDKTKFPIKRCDFDYIFPKIDLLEIATNQGNSHENCEAVIRRLVEVLAQFGISVFPGEIHKGPVITRYEVTPEAGVRVEKIANLDKNIALGLAAKSVRIIAPVPGKGCVGIELPNKNPASVHLREILESKNWAEMQAAIPIVLGRGVTGDPMIYDLAKMPHLLIAGATGSGKTVCINAIVASLLYHASPKDLRFIMVDPKIVEMQNYNKLPHMLIPVVTDPKKVPNALKWLIAEMELRYKIFAKAGMRNISNYNEKLDILQKLPQENDFAYQKFPYIVCIIDELADLMMIAPGDIETYIARLAQLARAAGIHLILATQRPSVNVITGIIKANLPSRIAFKVSSKVDSRTILDIGGAEALLGQGDMLFSPPGASGLLRAQGALVSDDEINRIVDFLYEENGGPKIEQSVQDQIESGGESFGGDDESWDDELIPRALEIIRNNDHASTSFLQRKLKIGYNRAARIMDTLREKGLVTTNPENEL